MKCPACQSERLRRSRHRPADGLWHSLFYTAYRCRDCGQRFQKLTSGLLLGFASTVVLALIFGIGVMVGSLLNSATPQAEPAPSSTPTPQIVERELQVAPAEPAGEISLAATAEGGDAKAQFSLGMAYLNGQGVERDLATARKWIERSAEQGYAHAQYTLGGLHHGGRGVLQSFPLAFQWLERAAQQNHAEAQYSLGLMYRSGQGIAVDKSKAYIWFNLAAAKGHERAREARDNLLPALTAEQVLAAQRAAQEWRPVPTKQ